MKKVLKILGSLLLLLILAVGGLLAYAATKPDDWAVERSIVIGVPPEIIFAQVNDLKGWDAWSPWKKLDPNAKMTFSDNPVGVGANFSWSGNSEVGEGTVKITESKPSEEITYELAFTRPMQDKSEATFTFMQVASNTKVTWRMYGTYQNIVHKAMCQVMNMDKMVGGTFEEGLANIKRVSERDWLAKMK